MEEMFYSCIELTSLNLSSFSGKNIFSTGYMFYDCKNLENIIFSENFTLENANTISSMFKNDIRLISIDLSYFNLKDALYMDSLFEGCENLRSIKNNEFNKIML